MRRLDQAARRNASRSTRGRWVPVVRVLPFVVFAALSIWAAGRAPAGRRPPEFDWTVTGEAVARATTKVPHLTWMAVLFGLALLAVGWGRAGLAAAMTLAVGLGWELAETTVVDHHAGLVDLVPDLVSVAVAWAGVAGFRAVLRRRAGDVRSAPARPQE